MNLFFMIGLYTLRRNLNAPSAGQILTGEGSGIMQDLLRCALRYDLPTMHAGARPKVENMIRRHNGFFVMFDHHHGIAEVA